MKKLYRMTLKESYWKCVPRGLVIQVASDNWTGCPSRQEICNVLHAMGFSNIEENDSVCCFADWDKEMI